mmetsp:Transcript_41391/g.123589  ORF Transcript_41391/g.123589 Transcript_41391/m.123589 type:complete len:287 (-) Transcript_41391:3906-4766(-)
MHVCTARWAGSGPRQPAMHAPGNVGRVGASPACHARPLQGRPGQSRGARLQSAHARAECMHAQRVSRLERGRTAQLPRGAKGEHASLPPRFTLPARRARRAPGASRAVCRLPRPLLLLPVREVVAERQQHVAAVRKRGHQAFVHRQHDDAEEANLGLHHTVALAVHERADRQPRRRLDVALLEHLLFQQRQPPLVHAQLRCQVAHVGALQRDLHRQQCGVLVPHHARRRHAHRQRRRRHARKRAFAGVAGNAGGAGAAAELVGGPRAEPALTVVAAAVLRRQCVVA